MAVGAELGAGLPCDVTARHYVCFAYLRIYSAVDGAVGVFFVPFDVSEDTNIASGGLKTLPIVSKKCMILSNLPGASVAESGSSSSNGAVSTAVVDILWRAPTT